VIPYIRCSRGDLAPGDPPDAPREHDVALAVGRGHSNAEIAAALHLSVPTVKAHVSRLLDKLDVDNRVQIALLVQSASRH